MSALLMLLTACGQADVAGLQDVGDFCRTDFECGPGEICVDSLCRSAADGGLDVEPPVTFDAGDAADVPLPGDVGDADTDAPDVGDGDAAVAELDTPDAPDTRVDVVDARDTDVEPDLEFDDDADADVGVDDADTSIPAPPPWGITRITVRNDIGVRDGVGYGGAGNTVPDTYEEFDLTVRIRNNQTVAYDNVTFVLTSGSAAVELPDDVSVFVDNLDPGESIDVGPFRVTTSTLDDGTNPALALATDIRLGFDALSIPLFVRDARADVAITFAEAAGGDGDGIPDAGETMLFSWTVNSVGTGSLPPQRLESEVFMPAWNSPRLDVAVESASAAATVASGAFTLSDRLAAGAALSTPTPINVSVAAGAIDGAPFCVRVRLRATTDGFVRYETTQVRCTTVTFGDVEECIDPDDDGYGVGTLCRGLDCNELNDQINEGAAELCDGIDNNCDGQIDEAVRGLYFLDVDGDGFGVGEATSRCVSDSDSGWALQAGDCNDSDFFINPGVAEVCDGRDNDCDDTIDEGVTVAAFRDSDLDTWGDASAPVQVCAGAFPANVVARSGDCAPEDTTIFPGAIEICDGLDNDCDRQIDEIEGQLWADVDGDGFGDPLNTRSTCAPLGERWVTNDRDCNDNDVAINPDAVEACDTADNNCNSQRDEGFNLSTDRNNCGACGNVCGAFFNCAGGRCVGFCEDVDTDGFFGRGECARANEDCNDSNNAVNPRAIDACNNGTDENCDGIDAICPDVCNALTQNCARPEAKCSYDGTGAAQCVSAGVRNVGETCSGFGINDSCAEGGFCAGFDGDPALCYEMCAIDGDCSSLDALCLGTITVGATEITSVCLPFPRCNPLAGAGACAAGSVCTGFSDTRTAPTTTFRCLEGGTIPRGGDCSAAGAICTAGTECINDGGPVPRCRAYCDRNTGSCPTGGLCGGVTNWPGNVGVCI